MAFPPRPLNYHNVYWDLVGEDDIRPSDYSNEFIAMEEKFKQVGIQETERIKLEEAKHNLDTLASIEKKAMVLALAHQSEAITMLFDETYNKAKADIMKPVGEFIQMVDERTKREVEEATIIALVARIVFITLGLLTLFGLLYRLYKNLQILLGGSIYTLHHAIQCIGEGDFSHSIVVPSGMEESILARLALMQNKLRESEAHSYRLTQLYAALSQCNQAIVRSNNTEELFTQICQDAVTFGGMRMAVIAMHNVEEKCIKPVAYDGVGIGYIQHLNISSNADNPTSQGPIGRAFLNNKPYWIQDFLHDPLTSLWHEYGKDFNWRGLATLPLCRNGIPVGVFALYASELNAFDELACKLLEEMATDISFALDTFEKDRLHDEAEKKSHMLAQVVEQSPNTILITDLDANIEYVNSAFTRVTGYEPFEVIGKNPRVLHSDKTPLEDYGAMWHFLTQGKSWVGEFINKRKNGEEYIEEIYISPLRDPDGKTMHYAAIKEDVTEQKAAQAQIYTLANFDVLTKLPNRARFNEHLERVLALSKQQESVFSLMFLDLDHFKDVNDSLGHAVGDLLLISASNRIKLALREEDVVSRLGGDEFIILLQGSDARGAERVAQKLLEAITIPFEIEGYTLSLSVSIGITVYPIDGVDAQTLVKNADSAMYRAKDEGRNTYRFFTESMQVASLRHLNISNALRQALDQKQFSVHYQPQLCATTGCVIGAEALLRWTHPQFGAISPVEFIPIAEENGMILPIGEWVLRTAVNQAKAWMEKGFKPIIMAVNLSAIQFRYVGLPDLIEQVLKEAHLSPEYLELELTESVAMHNPKTAIAIMDIIHAKGVRMSIDDFGTGYSSLNYLKKFQIYKLKIDQSFIRDISVDVEDRAIISAIINMSRSLGLKTIAEGVETSSQLAYLKEQGCDEIQGYFYSKPLCPSDFEAFRQRDKMC